MDPYGGNFSGLTVAMLHRKFKISLLFQCFCKPAGPEATATLCGTAAAADDTSNAN